MPAKEINSRKYTIGIGCAIFPSKSSCCQEEEVNPMAKTTAETSN
jgi:hypothetical protein